MEIRYTKDIALDGIKILVYGDSGAGKTKLMGTAPKPIVLSAESGLLALKKENVPYLAITNLEDMRQAYEIVSGPKGAEFETVCLDSISEIAEVVLNFEKKRVVAGKVQHGMAAYGATNDTIFELVRAFRDLPGKNVVFSAKLDKSTDEEGKIYYGPGMPGKTLGQGLPFFFDEVFALRCEKDEEGKTTRALLTGYTGLWSAKDRSGTLDLWEDVHLGKIINKIRGDK